MSLSIRPLSEWLESVHPPLRLAALDIGSKTIGLALSTPDWQMATPLTTVRRSKWPLDLAALDKALSGYGIGALIVGLPLNMDGTEGPAAQSIRRTTGNLIAADPKWIGPPGLVAFWDERLTTMMAEEDALDFGTIKAAKASGALDAMAAQIILERAVTYLRNHMNKEI
jgi:putative holliday junction resolvase